MRSKKEVHADFTESTQELLSILDTFPQEQFNTKSAPDSWSAGQVAEHLIKVEVGTVRFFQGGTKEADRDPEANIEPIRAKFFNFDDKLSASGPIVPDEQAKDQQRAIDKLQDTRQRLTSMIEIEDLTQLLTDFDHPLFGPLTRIEWLYFHIVHARRHCHQIENIKKSL